MKLNFGENIRKLRTERGLTQEKLADFLGVSFQAVSKWERGDSVPDIFMLPIIASFFGVTTDYLLQYDRMESEREIEAYEARYYQLWQSGERKALMDKMKEAVSRYPSEYRLLVRYLNAMVWYGAADDQNAIAVRNEVTAVYERIQNHCTTDSIRIWSKKILCDYYNKLIHIPGSGVGLEDIESIQAEMPLMQNSRDYLACFLPKDDKRDAACKNAISELLFLLNNVITQNWSLSSDLPLSERIEILETVIQANELFYKDQDYGKNHINMTYAVANLGCLHYEAGNYQKAKANIQKSLSLAEKFDLADATLVHTSKLLKGHCVDKTKIFNVHNRSFLKQIKHYIFHQQQVPVSIISEEM